MTPDQFFAKFALLSETPNAVAKMRELVLNLAVHGRLVQQNPDDEPVGKLIDRIIEKKRLLGIVVSASTKDFCADNMQISVIPKSWAMIGAISPVRIISDHGKKVQTKDILEIGKYPVVDQGKVFVRGYCDDPDKVIKVKEPIIVFGDHTRETKLITFDFVVGADGVKLLQPLEIDAHYYFLAMRWLPLESRGYGRHFKLLRESSIPLPPLAEQKRIVAKVDELMALCDQLESQQKQRETKKATLVQAALTRFTDAPTPANLEFLFHKSYAIDPAELRKTILTLAVTGRIVTQDYTDESAYDMLLRMSLSNGVDDGVRNKFLDVDLPQNWTKILLEEVAQIASGVTLGRKLGDRRTVTLPYLRVANVKRGEIDISDVKTVAIGEDEIERFALRAGDLLMIEGGDWDKVGRAAIWRGEIPNCLHQNHVFRVRMRTSELLPVWFERYINSPIGRRYFENAAKQTTNLASINMRQVRACPIPLPPLAEQKRIVAKVEELMALVDKLEAQLAASKDAGEKLIEAVVAAIAAAA